MDSAAYLTGHVVASFVGPIALSMAAGGIGNPWLLRAAIAVDVMSIINGIHKRSVLGVVGGLIGLRMGVKAYRNAMSSAGRRVLNTITDGSISESPWLKSPFSHQGTQGVEAVQDAFDELLQRAFSKRKMDFGGLWLGMCQQL